MCSSVDGDTKDAFTTSDQFRATGNFLRCEELRVICGTRGDPGTVAPFRAWRGSRDLVAQSPKFHAPALAFMFRESREKSSTASPAQPERAAAGAYISFGTLLDCSRIADARIRLSVSRPLLPAHPVAARRMDSPSSL